MDQNTVEVFDRRGRLYFIREIVNDPFYTLQVLKDGYKIGYCNFVVREGKAEILDIHLKQEEQPTHPIVRCLNFLRERKNHRGLGLGSHMLKMIEEHARWKGAFEITGWISRADMEHLSKTISFYRKFGYEVKHSDGWKQDRGHHSLEVARIKKTLGPI